MRPGTSGSALMAAGGEVVARGPNGERTLPLRGFFQGPFTTALDPTEVVCHVAQGVLVAAREHGVAKRSERRTSSIEIACPLEQHPVHPGRSNASED